MQYLALYEDGNASTFLTRDSQMEEHLSRGAKIYADDGKEMTLIATPTEGFLVERPVFPTENRMRVGIIQNAEVQGAER